MVSTVANWITFSPTSASGTGPAGTQHVEFFRWMEHTYRMPRARRFRRPPLAIAAALGVLVLGACGAPSPPAASQAPAPVPPSGPADPPSDEVTPPLSTTRPTMKATDIPHLCVGRPSLPGAVDSSVCSSHPEGAQRLQHDSGGPTSFTTAAGDVRCTETTTLTCSLSSPATTMRLTGQEAGEELASPAAPDPAEPTVIQNDTTVSSATFACRVQQVGVTCWSLRTRHGFFLSEATQKTW